MTQICSISVLTRFFPCQPATTLSSVPRMMNSRSRTQTTNRLQRCFVQWPPTWLSTQSEASGCGCKKPETDCGAACFSPRRHRDTRILGTSRKYRVTWADRCTSESRSNPNRDISYGGRDFFDHHGSSLLQLPVPMRQGTAGGDGTMSDNSTLL